MTRTFFTAAATFLLFAAAFTSAAEPLQPLRPPATPLVTVDPYFSVWSFTDRLTTATRGTGPERRRRCSASSASTASPSG
jgi:hypothetical protein